MSGNDLYKFPFYSPYDNDFCNEPNKEFCLPQNYLESEENGENEENKFYMAQNPIFYEDQSKLGFQKETEFYGDKLNEDDNNNLEQQNWANQEFFKKPIEPNKLDLMSPTTKYSTKLIGNKTKRNDDELMVEKQDQLNNQDLNIIGINENTKNDDKKKTQGRKKKTEKEKGDHTKHSEDNIIRKIKSHFFNKFHILLNKSIIDKNFNFIRMDSDLNENLKKDYNLALLNKTLKNLYENTKISSKFRSKKESNKDNNKNLIHKIYNEEKEIDTINLLNLTFRELFNVFTRDIKEISPELEMKIQGISLLDDDDFSNIDTFFQKLEERALRDGESPKDIQKYLEKVKKLCINFESWFSNKKGRNREKKKKNKIKIMHFYN